MRLFVSSVCAFFMLFATALAYTPYTIDQLHAEILNTSVRIDLSKNMGCGSGEFVYSEKRDGEWHTYVLTNHHVVAPHIQRVIEGPNLVLKYEPLELTTLQHGNLGKDVDVKTYMADIVAYDERRDLALLRLKNKKEGVLYTTPISKEPSSTPVGTEIWAVGSDVCQVPFPTKGIVSLVYRKEDLRFIQYDAGTFKGKSGGGLYHFSSQKGRFELIGVVVAVAGVSNMALIPHMGVAIHNDTVRSFLKEKGYAFILK